MTKAEQTRLTNWRFKVLQRAADGRSVARTCRHFGISRKTFYKWQRRLAEHGTAGLSDRPRRPHRFPRATPGEVVSKILYLRENYHFGAAGSRPI
jgi:transposase-like protein